MAFKQAVMNIDVSTLVRNRQMIRAGLSGKEIEGRPLRGGCGRQRERTCRSRLYEG